MTENFICPHCGQPIENTMKTGHGVTGEKPVEEPQPDTVIMYCDGAAESNGTENVRCYGSFKISGTGLHRTLDFPGAHTNNEAEYHALIEGLISLNNLHGSCIVECRSDSQLLVNQVTGNWKIKKPELARLRYLVMDFCQQHDITLKMVWVPREQIVELLGH